MRSNSRQPAHLHARQSREREGGVKSQSQSLGAHRPALALALPHPAVKVNLRRQGISPTLLASQHTSVSFVGMFLVGHAGFRA